MFDCEKLLFVLKLKRFLDMLIIRHVRYTNSIYNIRNVVFFIIFQHRYNFYAKLRLKISTFQIKRSIQSKGIYDKSIVRKRQSFSETYDEKKLLFMIDYLAQVVRKYRMKINMRNIEDSN